MIFFEGECHVSRGPELFARRYSPFDVTDLSIWDTPTSQRFVNQFYPVSTYKLTCIGARVLLIYSKRIEKIGDNNNVRSLFIVKFSSKSSRGFTEQPVALAKHSLTTRKDSCYHDTLQGPTKIRIVKAVCRTTRVDLPSRHCTRDVWRAACASHTHVILMRATLSR